MFGIWKRKDPEELEHFYVPPIHNFEISSAEFYEAIEREIEARKLTGLEITRIERSEGGPLSAKREYLRLRRERLVFDVCAASFGTEWFFSWRVAVIPAVLRLWEVIALFVFTAAMFFFYVILFGIILGPIFLAASLLSLLFVMRNTVSIGMHDVDAALLQIPVVGALYEAFLRKETYYVRDTRLAYKDIVTAVIRAKINEVTVANGVEHVEFKDATPPSHPAILSMIGDLLRMRS